MQLKNTARTLLLSLAVLGTSVSGQAEGLFDAFKPHAFKWSGGTVRVRPVPAAQAALKGKFQVDAERMNVFELVSEPFEAVSEKTVKHDGQEVPAWSRTLRLSGHFVTAKAGTQFSAADEAGKPILGAQPPEQHEKNPLGTYRSTVLYSEYSFEWDSTRDHKGREDHRSGRTERIIPEKVLARPTANGSFVSLVDATEFSPRFNADHPRRFKWTIQDNQSSAGVRQRFYNAYDHSSTAGIDQLLSFQIRCAEDLEICSLREGSAKLDR
jgi:hypothetical protein